MRPDQIAVMLRDLARRALQWADVFDGKVVTNLEFEDTGLVTPSPPRPPTEFITADTIPTHENVRYMSPTTSLTPPTSGQASPPTTWRRGDYFLCRHCGQNKQWFSDRPPWADAFCKECYDKRLGR